MHYRNAKGALIYDIYERIFAADPANPHDTRRVTKATSGSMGSADIAGNQSVSLI